MALLGALCWGLAPVFGKIGLRDVHPVDGLAVRTVITIALVAAFVLAGGRWPHVVKASAETWTFLAAEAFLATLAGDLAYYAAIKWGSAVESAVILAASPVFTVWFGGLILGERLSSLQLLGTAMVVLGIAFVGLGGRPG